MVVMDPLTITSYTSKVVMDTLTSTPPSSSSTSSVLLASLSLGMLALLFLSMFGSGAALLTESVTQHSSKRDAMLPFGQRTLLVQAKLSEPKIVVHSCPGEAYIPCHLHSEIPLRMR